MRFSFQFVTLAALVTAVLAQSPVWGQCGGINWTGSTTCAAGTSSPTSAVKANYWFSFGDSYTQTGFDPTLTLPTIGNPLGNPTYPGYTATGGENWVDYVTTEFNNSLLFTYNYAYGGATIDATLVAPYTPTVLSLTDQ
ncbi:hypothetical protein C0995_016339, partial [Termitomyces sp. Mi166